MVALHQKLIWARMVGPLWKHQLNTTFVLTKFLRTREEEVDQRKAFTIKKKLDYPTLENQHQKKFDKQCTLAPSSWQGLESQKKSNLARYWHWQRRWKTVFSSLNRSRAKGKILVSTYNTVWLKWCYDQVRLSHRTSHWSWHLARISSREPVGTR